MSWSPRYDPCLRRSLVAVRSMRGVVLSATLFCVVLGLPGLGSAADGPKGVSYMGYTSTTEAKAAVTALEQRVDAEEKAIDAWEKRCSNAEEQLAKLTLKRPDPGAYQDRIIQMNADLRRLLREKEEKLKEVSEGLICSGCMRTKNEILATENVFPHPGQSILSPSDPQVRELYRRKEEALNGPIRAKEAEIAAEQKRLKDDMARWQAAVDGMRALRNQCQEEKYAAQDRYYEARQKLIDAQAAADMLPLLERWAREAWNKVQAARQAQAQREAAQKMTSEKSVLQEHVGHQNYWFDRADHYAALEKAARDRQDGAAAAKAAEEKAAALKNASDWGGSVQQSTRRYQDSVKVYQDTVATSPEGDRESRSAKSVAQEGLDQVRKFARGKQRELVGDDIYEFMKIRQNQYLAPKLQDGPKSITGVISDAYKNAMNKILPPEKETPDNLKGLVRVRVKEYISNKVRSIADQFTREKMQESLRKISFGDKPVLINETGNAGVDQTEKKLEETANPQALDYDVGPADGGQRVNTVKRYLEDVQRKFNEFFDLGTKKIEDDAAAPKP